MEHPLVSNERAAPPQGGPFRACVALLTHPAFIADTRAVRIKPVSPFVSSVMRAKTKCGPGKGLMPRSVRPEGLEPPTF